MQIKKTLKHIYKWIGIFLLTVFTALSSLQLNIKANSNQPVTIGSIPNAGAVVRQGNRTAWWNALDKISVNGEIAFCIEPMTVGLGSSYYEGTIDPNTQNLLSKIVYHGWDTSAKTDNDYATTQFMVWESLGAVVTQWRGSFGDIYPTLKANVQAKIDSHEIRPAFHGNSHYEGNVNETISFYDDNYVINQFHVVDNGGTTAWIEGNYLHVIPNENTPDNTTITLQKFSEEHVGASIAYCSNNGQDVGRFKLLDPGRARVGMHVNKTSSLTIMKEDVDTGKAIKQQGISFKLKDKATGQYLMQNNTDVFITDENGQVTLPEKLQPNATYVIEEVRAPHGYLLELEGKEVTITPGQDITVRFGNKRFKGQIEVTKTGQALTSFENGQFVYEDRGLQGATFKLHAREDIVDPADRTVIYPADAEIAEGVSDDTGKILFDNLYEGKYYVKEIEAPYGFVRDEKEYDITVSYKNEHTPIVNVTAEVYNKRQRYLLDVQKLGEDNKPLQGAEFTVYANRDIYNIAQEVIVPAGTALEVATSDKNGNVKFTLDLPTDFTDPYKPMPINGEEELDPEFNVDYDYVGGIEMYGNPNSLFVVKETKAPESYVLKDAHYYINTEYQGQDKEEITISHEAINNKIKATLQVNKVDTYSQQPIISKDFAFGIYSDEACVNLLEKVHANTEDGTATFKDIKYGTYYIKEIEAPVGYLLSDEVKKAEITDTGVYINGEKVEEENQVYSFIYYNAPLQDDVVTGDDHDKTIWFFLSSISITIIGYQALDLWKKKKAK